MKTEIRLTESPRDAMQGLDFFVPTERKIEYVQSLLKIGFHTIDLGSFVSPKAVPQMSDTYEVASRLDLTGSKSRILVLVGNARGAKDACTHSAVSAIGFPFSISETFLKNNINSDLERSKARLEEIADLCRACGKEFVVYISMAFGNPYGDEWSVDLLLEWVEHLQNMGIHEISLSDTIGWSTPPVIKRVFSKLIPAFPETRLGFHLHSQIHDWEAKIDAAYKNGCRSFDGVLNGLGGCPMTGYDLVSNIPTRPLVRYLLRNGEELDIDRDALEASAELGQKLLIFRNL